jgi:predicted GNAT family acetyltransferase
VEPLDNPVWHALSGPQATLAEGSGVALRYREDFAPFGAVADARHPEHWRALARVVGAGGIAAVFPVEQPGDGWTTLHAFRAHQMVLADDRPVDRRDDVTVDVLAAGDVADMTALVAAAAPGPWRSRTHELGEFLGVRVDGRLVAMAGQRMQLPDATEVSAVCTDPAYRGAGYARVLVAELVTRIRDAGRRPFLHVLVENQAAIRLYEQLGFHTRRTVPAAVLQAPGG